MRTQKNLKHRKLTKNERTALYHGLTNANFAGLKIKSMHLVPNVASTANTPSSAQGCHAVQLPDGSWTIVCD
jgi:hypothetical protein